MTTDNRTNEPRRLKSCVDAWPECSTGDYNPACCRFPKSCSAMVYSDEHVTEDDLEPRAALVAAQGAARPVNSFDTTVEREKNWGDSLHVAPELVIDEAALAEVRSQAAEEALLKAADAFEGGEINIEIFGDSVEARLWRMSNQKRASLVKSLRARAAEYRKAVGS